MSPQSQKNEQIDMYKEVFISHAKEDVKLAEQLYDYLSEKGYSPWLDKKKLRVGANWDYEIKKALKESTYVIILLSSTSVKKRGYIQKEFKYALEYSESKLDDDIYIIPILLDKCEVPDQLSKFQWLEVENDKFKESILESLNFQRQKYLDSLSADSIKLNEFTSVSLELNLELGNKIDYQCDLPLFQNNNYFDSNFINIFIQQKAYETISDFRNWIVDEKEYFQERSASLGYIEIGYNINFLSTDYLSMSITCDSYLGGAHPNTSIDTLNFKLNPEIVIRLRDLIEYNNLQEFITQLIEKYGDEEQKEYLPKYVEYLDRNVNFTFDDKTLTISFINVVPRVIMALGMLEVPLKDLKLKNTQDTTANTRYKQFGD